MQPVALAPVPVPRQQPVDRRRLARERDVGRPTSPASSRRRDRPGRSRDRARRPAACECRASRRCRRGRCRGTARTARARGFCAAMRARLANACSARCACPAVRRRGRRRARTARSSAARRLRGSRSRAWVRSVTGAPSRGGIDVDADVVGFGAEGRLWRLRRWASGSANRLRRGSGVRKLDTTYEAETSATALNP